VHTATFFLSTGRCGTQWLARALSDACSGSARVEHEPLADGYRWRELLGGAAPGPALAAHVDTIERTLEASDYIETGYPCWSALPWLAERLGERMKIVHLIRHPVPTALSWVSNAAYAEPYLPGLPGGRVLLTPDDAGVCYPHYADIWPALSRYEKCLWFWAELHTFAERLLTRIGRPSFRLRFEELFGGAELRRFGEFLGLPVGEALERARTVRTDKNVFLIDTWVDPDRIASHREVLDSAERLGYDPLAFDEAALRKRYSLFG